ncbi:MAG: tetratricopeptide repeat protein [Bacteroidia bacterium]
MSTPGPTYTLAQMRAYLEGSLSPDLTQRMEADLAQDPLLAGAMERLEAELDRQARSPEELAALEAAFRQAIPRQDPAQKSRPLWQPLAIAAGMALLVGALFWTQFAAAKAEPEAVFAAHFSPYEDLITQRGEAEDSFLIMAMAAYNEGDFERANNIFKILCGDLPDSRQITEPINYLYYANSLLAAGNTQAAIEQLSKLEKEGEGAMNPVVKWYSALAYLKAGKTEDAVSYLEALKAEGGGYAKRAEEVLEEL